MSRENESPFDAVSRVMRRHGAERIVFKLLSNNDNSKQQVYVGSEFDVLRLIPHGDLVGQSTSEDGLMFKAKIKLSWIDIKNDSCPSPADGAQIIFYPRYPEVRMSGFLRGSEFAPRNLMQPPTKDERLLREKLHRCLVFGICEDGTILGFLGEWEGELTKDAKARIADNSVTKVAGVFYELKHPQKDDRIQLIERITEIYRGGPVKSCRLSKSGELIDYNAINGAGYTFESLFGIIPNGNAEPDFNGWELKSHGRGPVTLMTPEPDLGSYKENLSLFISLYGVERDLRKDFTGRHLVSVPNFKSGLTLQMEGYDPILEEVTDPEGGLILRDCNGNLAAGWTFNKILTHWSRKHSKAAYVSYVKLERDVNYYHFGAEVVLCEGAGLKELLRALYSNVVYHDPGINMKYSGGRWVSKKRNQFRVLWKNIDQLYGASERINISGS